jgi:hypothetical protein
MATLAEAFANSCQEAAQWRESRAAEDHDVRHLHSAEALRTAASWALSAGESGERLRRLLSDVPQTDQGLLLLGPRAQSILASYCFEGPEGLDRWLGRLAEVQYEEEYELQQQVLDDGT